MAEVALVWYSMADNAVTANRGQVRRWAAELGLPTGPMSKAHSVLALRRAVADTVLDFLGDDGRTWSLIAMQRRRSERLESYTVYAKPPVGKMKRLGEVQLFLARRLTGPATKAERLKKVTATAVTDLERTALLAWFEHFTVRFEDLQGPTPHLQVRNVVRLRLVAEAMPVLHGRFGMYYTYVDRLPRLRAVETFLLRSAPGAVFIVLPIEAGPDQHQLFAQAAEHQVQMCLEALLVRVDAMGRRTRGAAREAVGWREELGVLEASIDEHEHRLGLPLPQARARLAMAYEAVWRLDPMDDLLRVTR